MLLAGCKLATAFIKRMYSPAHRIYNCYRSRMKAEKLQRLSLSFFYLRVEARILADTVLVAVNGIDYDEAGLQN